MTNQTRADDLAHSAVTQARHGMKIGVGAGRTAARGIRALAERVRNDGLSVHCVAGSEASDRLCRELGLTMVDFASVEELDLLIDGADEVDRSLRVMKGSRGAVTRERMLAWASRRTVYMVTADKVSERIGSKSSLAVAVMFWGLASTRAAIRSLGLNGVVRRDLNNEPFVTDNGNLILDVTLAGTEDVDELAASLNDIPGVIDHGLFVCEADEILVEHADGTIERIARDATPE
jgi:ribose 5-phosphate isomerase A